MVFNWGSMCETPAWRRGRSHAWEGGKNKPAIPARFQREDESRQAYGDEAATSGPGVRLSPMSWTLMSKRSVPSRPTWSVSACTVLGTHDGDAAALAHGRRLGEIAEEHHRLPVRVVVIGSFWRMTIGKPR
jgi:hypothetical protein